MDITCPEKVELDARSSSKQFIFEIPEQFQSWILNDFPHSVAQRGSWCWHNNNNNNISFNLQII